MTPTEMTTYIRTVLTRTDAFSLPDDVLLILLNQAKDYIAKRFLRADNNYFTVPDYSNLVASATTRHYQFPDNFLSKLLKVEVKFDGTNWVVLKGMDIRQHDQPSSETEIVGHFSNSEGECFYEVIHGGIRIFSGTIEAVTDGLKLTLNTYPEDITDLTETTDYGDYIDATSHGLPKEIHELLCRRVSMLWKQSREKPIPLNEWELSFDRNLMEEIALATNTSLDNAVIGKLPDASTRGDSGFEY